MTQALKKYNLPIRFLFQKYANTTNHASKNTYLSDYSVQTEQITFSDL